MSTDRELTNDELDAVSGGTRVAVEYHPQKADGSDGGGGSSPPTIGGGGGLSGIIQFIAGQFT
jgi:bacteriocin-like protein